MLGTAGTDAAKTPPVGCEIFVADDGAEACSAFIKGCTPRNADTYSATLAINSSGALYDTVGDWVDSVTETGTAVFDIALKNGTFSQTPGCTASGYAASFGGEAPVTAVVLGNYSGEVVLALFDETGAAFTCGAAFVCVVTVTCTGR